MKKALVFAALALAAACSRDSTSPGATADLSARFSKGPLTFQVEDFAAQAGVFWALPSVTTSAGTVTVQNTRYGSLCRLAVDGNAAVNGSHITLDVSFDERTNAVCTQEIRALRYTASIAAAAGTYDVTVVHHDGAQADTLVQGRSVVVP